MQLRLSICVLIVALAIAGVSADIPAGFTTFFNAGGCPDGWFELGTAQGRMIVSVSQPSDSGITVGTPLKDREDRTHAHNYTTTLDLPVKNIAADDCCNGQGACSGGYDLQNSTFAGTSGLPFVQLVLCTINSTSSNAIPFGTIGYFEPSVSQCPDNWKPLTEVNGRVIIPGFSATGITVSDAKPLASGEDRAHGHDLTVSVEFGDVEYAGIDGCCNDHLGPSGVQSVSVTTDSTSSGLPYIQLLTCVNQEQTFDSDLPTSTLLFNEVSCPPGWNVTLIAAGRFPVALPNPGVPGATFGGRSLSPTNTSDVPHAHAFQGYLDTTDCEVGLASGCCADGYARNQPYHYSGVSGAGEVDIPYVAVPMCEQVSAPSPSGAVQRPAA